MRITCDIEILNRLLPSLNLRGKGKTSRASLAVGRSLGCESKTGTLFLMVCTNKDKNGTKYKIKDNIEQVFGKFANHGKATIRFIEPAHDLSMKNADPLQLKSFLRALKLGLEGHPHNSFIFSRLTPAVASQVQKPKTKLVILHRRDYPVTTGFPSSLGTLQINQCSLCRIDTRILRLRHLHTLDLCNNKIKTLPECWENMFSLAELIIHHNQLEVFPETLCTSQLQRSLRLLDLSHNQLTILPKAISNLQQLVTFKVNNNQISELPRSIGGLNQLRFFSASGNKIKHLPASFVHLNLEIVALWGNSFQIVTPSKNLTALHFVVPKLLELAAQTIEKQRILIAEDDIPFSLQFYLKDSQKCVCGSPCFESSVKYITTIDLRSFSQTVISENAAEIANTPLEVHLCSQRCYNLYGGQSLSLKRT